MNPSRISIVLKAFQALDKDHTGQLDLKDLEAAYLSCQSQSSLQKKGKANAPKDFLETFGLHHALTVRQMRA